MHAFIARDASWRRVGPASEGKTAPSIGKPSWRFGYCSSSKSAAEPGQANEGNAKAVARFRSYSNEYITSLIINKKFSKQAGFKRLADPDYIAAADVYRRVCGVHYVGPLIISCTFLPRRKHMTITGSCHCGKNAFSIDGDIPTELTRCTCSFCSKRGALLAYYQPSQFHAIAQTNDDDAIYRWNTKLVAHHFCSECGCATYTDSPAFEQDGSWDKVNRRIGVNARLFDNFDAAAAPVAVIDGKNLW